MFTRPIIAGRPVNQETHTPRLDILSDKRRIGMIDYDHLTGGDERLASWVPSLELFQTEPNGGSRNAIQDNQRSRFWYRCLRRGC